MLRRSPILGPRQRTSALSPLEYPNLAAWYDASNRASMIYDSAGRVSLLSDISGKSNVNGLVLNGVSGNYASTPDSAALSITGDIECVASKASLTSVAGGIFGIFGTFLGKWSSSDSNRSFRFIMALSGTMRLQVSTDGTFSEGTTGYTFTSDASANLSSNSYFKWSLDLDNGLGTAVAYFFESQDGITWSQVGGDISYGSTISGIYDSPAVLTIGLTNPASPADIFGGRIGGITLKNGINGTTVFDADFTAQAKLSTSFTESSTNAATVTINSTGDTGARICGERDLVQLTASKQPIYLPFSGEKYGYVNGVAGNYFSTPDSAALDITGDIDLRAEIAPASWAPSGSSYFIMGKYRALNNDRSYAFQIVQTTGVLRFIYARTGGTVVTTSDSTLAPGFSANSKHWVRVTRQASTGDIVFYTSSDGVSWTQLGGVVSSAVEDIHPGAASLEVGAIGDGATSNMFNGAIYKAEVYSGIAGTLVARFNAQDYNSGSTFVSSATGNTWTLNGGSHIVQRSGLYFGGVSAYVKSASFPLAQPENVYFVGEQITWVNGSALYDGNTTASGRLYQNNTTSQVRLAAGTASSLFNSWALRAAAVMAVKFNSAQSSIRKSREAEEVSDAGLNNMDGFTLGSRPTPSDYSNIFVSEIAIYDQTPDPINKRDRIALYAARKWGFAV